MVKMKEFHDHAYQYNSIYMYIALPSFKTVFIFYLCTGYEGEYLKRSGDKVDGCATFYNTAKLKLDRVAHVNYFKPGVPTLNRDNVGLLLLLRAADVETDARLCVANTHLLFNPKRGDVKLAQLQLLFAEIDKLAFRRELLTRNLAHGPGQPRYHPIVLCGDFNALPMSKLYEFVRRGALTINGLPQKVVSGQERYPSSMPQLGSALIPEALRISDQCQHVDVFRERCRAVEAYHDVNTREIEELRRIDESPSAPSSPSVVKDAHKNENNDVSKKRTTGGGDNHHRPGLKKRRSIDDGAASSNGTLTTSADTTVCTCTDGKHCLSMGHTVHSFHTSGTTSCTSTAEASALLRHGDKHRHTGLHVDLRHSSHDPRAVVIPKEQLVLQSEREPPQHHQTTSHVTTSDAPVPPHHVTQSEQRLRELCSHGSGRLSHELRFDSVYEHEQHVDGRRCKEVTTCHGRAKFTVDYIFYHRGSTNKERQAALKLLERYRLYTAEEMFEIGKLPQEGFPSDHMILMGAFQWKESYGD